MTLCIYLLRMREFFRWEQGIAPMQPLPLHDRGFDPFDAADAPVRVSSLFLSAWTVDCQAPLVSRQSRVSRAANDRCAVAFSETNFKGASMEADLVTRITNDPKYHELKSKRASFGWWLTLAMMVAYYGFILLVAFDKSFLAQKLGAGVMTVGMPLGVAVIVFTIVITAIYVWRANSEFDDLTEKITKGALK